jgi:hypothetical protein
VRPPRSLITALPLALILLAGCTAVPERSTERQPFIHPWLADLGSILPGDYSTSLTRQQRIDGAQPLLLNVRQEAGSEAHQAVFVLSQQQPGAPTRSFLLGLEASDRPDQLDGFFAPVDAQGQIHHRCNMRFMTRHDGFSAQTEPSECRFGQGEQTTGLLKEIAFDGSQLVIGDRLIRLHDDQSLGEDQIHAFHRVRHFTGWAGQREGETWRVASSFQLHTADDYFEPVDAAGMSLGFGISLARHDSGPERGQLLRISVIDLETGKVLAQSWADPDAELLGLALPDLQVGLQPAD